MTADLELHPLAKAIPEMLTDEFADLVADIKAHGLQTSVVMFEGKILDGWHRYRACTELGIPPKFVPFTGTDAEAEAFVLSINVHRRHLTLKQKQEIIAAELTRDPAQSDQAIAKKVKASPTTVGKARAKADAQCPKWT